MVDLEKKGRIINIYFNSADKMCTIGVYHNYLALRQRLNTLELLLEGNTQAMWI